MIIILKTPKRRIHLRRKVSELGVACCKLPGINSFIIKKNKNFIHLIRNYYFIFSSTNEAEKNFT